jgi:hypothetical protein
VGTFPSAERAFQFGGELRHNPGIPDGGASCPQPALKFERNCWPKPRRPLTNYWTGQIRLRGRTEVEAFTAKWQPIIPEAVQCLLKDVEDCLRFYDFPKKHWRSIRTNNYIERLFNGVKMRTHSMGAFRNENSCILIFYAVIRSMHFRKLSLPA